MWLKDEIGDLLAGPFDRVEELCLSLMQSNVRRISDVSGLNKIS